MLFTLTKITTRCHQCRRQESTINITETYSGSVCKAGLQNTHSVKITTVEKFFQLKQKFLEYIPVTGVTPIFWLGLNKGLVCGCCLHLNQFLGFDFQLVTLMKIWIQNKILKY